MRTTLEEDVQKRILALSIFFTRAVLETHLLLSSDAEKAMEENEEAARGLSNQYHDILKNNGEIFSPSELTLLNLPFGSWTEVHTNRASWSNVCFGVLKWAVHLIETIPEYDVHLEAEDIGDVDMDKSKLRTETELNREFERGKLWNWRIGFEFERRTNPEAHEMSTLFEVANDALSKGFVQEIVDGDLKAFGKAVSMLTTDELTLLGAIAYARLKALAWMVNDFDDPIKSWDAMESDT